MNRFLLALLAVPLASAQVELEFQAPDASYIAALPLRNGKRLLVGTATRVEGTSQLVVGNARYGGSGNMVPSAALLDSAGNIWIAGDTDSEEFELVNPMVAQKAAYRTAGFVIELSAAADRILLATYLCGSKPARSGSASHATALAADSAGNVYVGGHTNESDFPTTFRAFAGTGPGISPFYDVFTYSYVAKIGAGGKLVYSTLVTSQGGCSGGGSGCIGRQSTSADVRGLAVDGAGAVTVAGILGSTFQYPSYYYTPGGGYIGRLAPDGSKALWLTSTRAPYGPVATILMALDSSGGIDLFGSYRSVVGSPSPIPAYGPTGLFSGQLRPDGSGFAWFRDLGQSADAHASGILASPSGGAYLAGSGSGLSLGGDFLVRIDGSGTPVQPALRLPRGVIAAPPSFAGDGQLVLPGPRGAVLTVPADYDGTGPPALVGFANAASYEWNTGLFPGALVSLYGFGWPGSIEGLQVTVDGRPAPILYAGANQINIQAPPAVFQTRPQVKVVSLAGEVSVNLPASQALGLFTTDGVHAAALNQDGSVNSASQPAPAGSVVSLFGTGAIWPADIRNSQPFDPDLNQFAAFSAIRTPLNILYAGPAPGIVNGVFRIDVQITPTPPENGEYGITLTSHGLASNAVKVYVK